MTRGAAKSSCMSWKGESQSWGETALARRSKRRKRLSGQSSPLLHRALLRGQPARPVGKRGLNSGKKCRQRHSTCTCVSQRFCTEALQGRTRFKIGPAFAYRNEIKDVYSLGFVFFNKREKAQPALQVLLALRQAL